MSATRARRLLIAAFAISLLVHLAVAFVWHARRSESETGIEKVSIEHRQLIKMTKIPTPPPPSPRPRITPAPHPAPTARAVPRKNAAPAFGTGGPGRATATPAPTPAPAATVAATPAFGCADPEAGAAVTANPDQPDVANAARAAGTSGITEVNVRLDAKGAVTAAAVAQSSGNASLDLVAVALARAAQYSPALHECKPVAGDYTYSVRFWAW